MVTEGVKEDVDRLAPLVLLDVVFDISKPLGRASLSILFERSFNKVLRLTNWVLLRDLK